MKKVSSKEAIYKNAVILQYWGRFHNYFNLWEYYQYKNKEIEFIFFTDNQQKINYTNSKK